jgi:hypothetical protein
MQMDVEHPELNVQLGVRKLGKRGNRVGSDQDGDAHDRLVRRCRVEVSSSSQEAEAEKEAYELGSEGGDQSAASSDWGDLCTDHKDPTWDCCDWAELRAYFSICRIDPHLGCDCREPASQVCSQISRPKPIFILVVDDGFAKMPS